MTTRGIAIILRSLTRVAWVSILGCVVEYNGTAASCKKMLSGMPAGT